jgi:N utilization substance protein A
VAFVPLNDLTSIEGFDENVATELRARARDWLEAQKKATEEKLRELGMEDKLLALGLPNEALIKLGENKVLTLDDFADLSSAEFRDFVPDTRLSGEEIDSMIMKAREHWFAAENNNQATDNG